MSTVILQIGQGGNQIGQEFIKEIKLVTGLVKDSISPFIRRDGKVRSVNVDTEPKVIRKLRLNNLYSESNVITANTGSGSNWALGYHGMRCSDHGTLVEATMEAMRREVERCDQYCGTVLLHSLAGGTGSGLTSRLCVELRDTYPIHYLMSCAVAPCHSGESPLQHYNSLLALSYLQRYTDAVILLRNDDILRGVLSSGEKDKQTKSAGLLEVNKNIADTLCGLFLPTDTLTTSSRVSIGREPWDLIGCVAPMPSTKFIHTSHVSCKNLNWEGLIGRLLSSFPPRDEHGKHYSSLAAMMVARGGDSSVAKIVGKQSAKILSTFGCVAWNPSPLDCWTARRGLDKLQTSLTAAVNTSYITGYLERVLDRARVMYDSGAYLHWYRRHCDIDLEMQSAFEEVTTVAENYRQAIS